MTDRPIPTCAPIVELRMCKEWGRNVHGKGAEYAPEMAVRHKPKCHFRRPEHMIRTSLNAVTGECGKHSTRRPRHGTHLYSGGFHNDVRASYRRCHMALSKRLRFEILRRDNHQCRYCGATAPDVKLTVDHVLPIALGGTDTADNCVAACVDCNAGKAATSPSERVVEQVSADAIRWSAAVAESARIAIYSQWEIHDYRFAIEEEWDEHCIQELYKQPGYVHPRPDHWPDDVERLRRRGMPLDVLKECVRITGRAPAVYSDNRWRHFMGCAWKRLADIEERAREIFAHDVAKKAADE